MNLVALALNGQVTFFNFDTPEQADTKLRKVMQLLKLHSTFKNSVMQSFVKARIMAKQTNTMPVLCLMMLKTGELQPFAYCTETAEEAVATFNKAANHANQYGACAQTTTMFI